MGKKPRKFDAPGHRVPTQLCPKCGWLLDAATCFEDLDVKPRPNDYTVCIGCAALLCFTDKLLLRATTPDDVADLKNIDPEYLSEIRRHQIAVLMTPKDDKPKDFEH